MYIKKKNFKIVMALKDEKDQREKMKLFDMYLENKN